MVLITRPDFIFGYSPEVLDEHKRGPRMLGVLFALMGAFLATGVYASIRTVGSRIHPISLVVFMGGVTFLLSSLWILVSGISLSYSTALWGVMSAMGVCEVLGQVMFMKGVQMEEAGPASLVRNLDIIVSFILQVLFLKNESFQWLAVLGSALILASIVYVGVEKFYRDKKTALMKLQDDLANQSLLDANQTYYESC